MLEMKNYNYNITLTYENLFSLIDNKLFFIVSFKSNNTIWKIGYHIIKELNIAFNQDKKTISFPKKRIDKNKKKINIKNDTGQIILISSFFFLAFLAIFMVIALYYFCHNCKASKEKERDENDLESKFMIEMEETVNVTKS